MPNDLSVPRQWLAAQRTQGRDLLMIMNKMEFSDPMVQLFGHAPVAEYVNLYQGTEFEDLSSQGPWLVRLEHHWRDAFDYLLSHPQQHWGWIGSVPRLDMPEMAEHWRERLLIHENGQRFYYRFQDNRVIARQLTALSFIDIPLLLGPLTSVLCWDGEHWQTFENRKPALYPALPYLPWAAIPEAEPYASRARRTQLRQILFEQHMPAAKKRLRQGQPLDEWLDEQTALAQQWQWLTDEQLLFLVAHRLDPEQAEHPAWPPRTGETPDAHYQRCRQTLHAHHGNDTP